MKKSVLLVIDPQNDYFEGGLYPLWNTQVTLNNMLTAMKMALEDDMPIILVQHVADVSAGIAPFFNPETTGVDIHSEIKLLASKASVVVKHFADAFEQTNLQELLVELNVDQLLLCGMMTQNCITHTALSKSAEAYDVKILSDACTTKEALLHLIALKAISTRIPCVSIKNAF